MAPLNCDGSSNACIQEEFKFALFYLIWLSLHQYLVEAMFGEVYSRGGVSLFVPLLQFSIYGSLSETASSPLQESPQSTIKHGKRVYELNIVTHA